MAKQIFFFYRDKSRDLCFEYFVAKYSSLDLAFIYSFGSVNFSKIFSNIFFRYGLITRAL